MSQRLAAELFRMAGESIEVRAAPLDGILAEAGARRSRRRHRIVGGVLVGAVLAGAGTWVAVQQTAADDLGTAEVRGAANPAGVAWYADGWLHLDRVAVALPAPTAVSELNGGALYAAADGTVAFVAADGDRRRLGHQRPGTPVVTSPAIGWAAWVDAGDEGSRVVAYDVSTGRVLATRPVGPAVRLVAIDQGRVYYEDDDGTFAWTPGAAEAEVLPRAGLVDVESATRVYQDGRRVDMVQPFFSVDFLRRGIGGVLSGGALHLLTRSPADGVGPGPFRPLLYDVTSGERLPTGVGPEERVVDAAFGEDRTLTYLVQRATAPAGDALVLRECSLGVGCRDVESVPTDAGRPLLAH